MNDGSTTRFRVSKLLPAVVLLSIGGLALGWGLTTPMGSNEKDKSFSEQAFNQAAVRGNTSALLSGDTGEVGIELSDSQSTPTKEAPKKAPKKEPEACAT